MFSIKTNFQIENFSSSLSYRSSTSNVFCSHLLFFSFLVSSSCFLFFFFLAQFILSAPVFFFSFFMSFTFRRNDFLDFALFCFALFCFVFACFILKWNLPELYNLQDYSKYYYKINQKK